ncbi:MAG TPA: Yip1 family protein [Gammaproteobacteria bacterium]|nr:Yip1 family protein [Gammaproteobacteria bacterium]
MSTVALTHIPLAQRARNILFRPRQEWDIIAAEDTPAKALYLRYILPLAAIGPVAAFIRDSIFGVSIPLVGHYRIPIGSGIAEAVVAYALTLIGVYVLAFVIAELAMAFGGEKSLPQALKVAAYSSTPVWVAGVLHLVPLLGILILFAGIYSLYLLYLGLPPLMRAPREKSVGYTLGVIVAAIVIYIVIGVIAGSLVTLPTASFTIG